MIATSIPRALVTRMFRRIGLPTWAHCCALFVLAFALYANTLSHQWAFDDPLVYTENPGVQDGLAGIPRILSSDAYAHLYQGLGREEELTGGRYRPLSLVSFALEHEIFGNEPVVAHAGNVILFALSTVLLFILFRRSTNDTLLAFLAAALFAAHPIHTEVVANVKGRDEIFSLLFITLALVTALGPGEGRRSRASRALVGLFTFLALLSKEYGVALVLLVPAARYVVRGDSAGRAMRAALPVAVAIAAYLPLRLAAVGLQQVEAVDLLNDPYLLASPEEEWATKVWVLLRYLGLLVWPHPLASDYGYRQIAYRSFQDPIVWASIIVHLALLATAAAGIARRHWVGLAALLYLAPLFLVSNFVVQIGATMGERLVYHGSAGFVLVLAGALLLLVRGRGPRGRGSRSVPDPSPGAGAACAPSTRIGRVRTVAVAFLAVGWIGALSALTVARNRVWYDDTTLFLHDVRVVPESARVNSNAGRGFLALADGETDPVVRGALVDSAIVHLERALAIDPEIVAAYFQLGAAFDRKGDYGRMEDAWNEARTRFPDHPLFRTYDPILADRLARSAVAAMESADTEGARELLERAVRYQPEDARLWLYLGRARSANGDAPGAAEAARRARALDPSLP